MQQVVREYAEPFADEIKTDLHGNVLLSVNPDAEVRVLLAGHADQIGMIISYIDDNGFVYIQTVGGWDPQQLVGQRVSIWTSSGPVNGVISRKPIHLLEESERKQVVKVKELWIDIGAANREQALTVVSIGDPVTLQLGYQELQNNLVNGPAMDDRCGVWVVVEAMRRAKEMGVECGLYVASTVQEEVGLRGAKTAAYSVNPHVGIAVDVTHATDCPGIDQRQQGDISIASGPVIVHGPSTNPKVVQMLQDISSCEDIPYQIAALGRAAPNDSNALQVSREGVATGIVAIPNRYMHSSVETISLEDIQHAASLLAKFVCSVQSADAFIP
ncbi:MAG: M42 family metallopeptidase [Planctomycetota bacterium]